MKARRRSVKIELPEDFPLMPYRHDEITAYLFHNYLRLFKPLERAVYSYLIADAKNALSKAHGTHTVTMGNEKHTFHHDSRVYDSMKKEDLERHPEIIDLLAQGNAAYYEAVKERLFREHADKIFLNRCPKCKTLCKTPKACLCPNPTCNHTWYESRQAS